MAKTKVAVIFGGVSNEHNLSCATAVSVINSIPKSSYDIVCIGITKKGRWLYFPGDTDEIVNGQWEQNPDCVSAVLSPDPIHRGIIIIEDKEVSIRKIDVVFPVLQGKFGADGSLQGLLDMSGIPYVGCGLLASASCTDKSHTHMVLDDYGIKTAKWKLITQREINFLDEKCRKISNQLGFPLIVKPANSGSNIGSSVAKDDAELLKAVKMAFSNDNKVVVERYISGRKLEVAVTGYENPEASCVGEISFPDMEYDPTKAGNGKNIIIPADIPENLRKKIRETAVNAFKALGCKGMARVEFFLTGDGELLLNKIITATGLRQTSIFPKLMDFSGTPLPELTDRLLQQAIENSERTY